MEVKASARTSETTFKDPLYITNTNKAILAQFLMFEQSSRLTSSIWLQFQKDSSTTLQTKLQ